MKNKINAVCNKVRSTKVAQRISSLAIMVMLTFYGTGNFASASSNGPDLSNVTKPIVGLLKNLQAPLLTLVGAGGALYCIVLGAKYATAEEPQEREKRKQALKTAIIGYILIFVLVVALTLSIDPLTEWMNSATQGK